MGFKPPKNASVITGMEAGAYNPSPSSPSKSQPPSKEGEEGVEKGEEGGQEGRVERVGDDMDVKTQELDGQRGDGLERGEGQGKALGGNDQERRPAAYESLCETGAAGATEAGAAAGSLEVEFLGLHLPSSSQLTSSLD